MKTTQTKNKVIITQSHYRKVTTSLEVLHLPIIEFEKLNYNKKKLQGHYDWVVVTSKNTVKFFKNELQSLSYTHIASIGKTTTDALIEEGFEVDFEPSAYTQEGFMEEFKVESGSRILYPASNEKRPLMRDFMRSKGADVVEINLYHPIGNQASIKSMKTALNEVDAITFSSPSGVHVFMKIFDRENLQNLMVVSIGHVTKKALDSYQVSSISPPYATLESMIRLLGEELNNEI